MLILHFCIKNNYITIDYSTLMLINIDYDILIHVKFNKLNTF